MANTLLRLSNYVWHSVAAPSASFTFNGMNIHTDGLVSVRSVEAKDAVSTYEKGESLIFDKVHEGLKTLQGLSPCQIMDEAEERRLLSLSNLVKNLKITPCQPILMIEQIIPARKTIATTMGIGSENLLKSALREAIAKVSEYDDQYPLWKEQRRRQPNDQARAYAMC